MRPTWADIDLHAIAHNVKALKATAAPAELCAVVKADGYGHGAVPVARAAVSAGASWLAVATVDEGRILRNAGIAAPILLLSEPSRAEMIEVASFDLTPSLYTGEGAAAAAAAAVQCGTTVPVHLNVDTGMGRVGCRPDDVPELVRAIDDKPTIRLEGIWTHFPVADEEDEASVQFTAGQVALFDELVDKVGAMGHTDLIVHAANSAGTIAHPGSRAGLVRVGIALYGIAPAPALAGRVDLEPAVTLRSEISMVKRVPAGTSISYGRTWQSKNETTICTVPIGYADGVRRSLSSLGGEVLVRGRRYPMVGRVTMDQLMFDAGDDQVEAGDDVVVMGIQGDDEITPEEIAIKLDTIAYEVVCDIGPRVHRRYRER